MIKIGDCALRLIRLLSVMVLLTMVSLAFINPLVSAQHDSEDESPDYTKSLIVDNHFIEIKQESETTLLVDENIWFNNTGDEDFAGKIYAWSQPGNILKEIRKFSVVYDGTVYNIQPHPTANFLYINTSEEDIVLKPGETLQLAFAYTLEYPVTETNLFGMTFLYNTKNILITFEPFQDTKVKGEDNFEMIYLASSNKYVTQHSETLSRIQGEGISISFSKSFDVEDDVDDDDSQANDPENEEAKEGGDTSNIALYIGVGIVTFVSTISLIGFLMYMLGRHKEKSRKNFENESHGEEIRPLCSKCGNQLGYVREYKRWYCHNCRQYSNS